MAISKINVLCSCSIIPRYQPTIINLVLYLTFSIWICTQYTVVFVFFFFFRRPTLKNVSSTNQERIIQQTTKKAGQYLICAKWQSHAKMSRRLIQQKWLLKMASFQVKDQFPVPLHVFCLAIYWRALVYTCMYVCTVSVPPAQT